MRPNARIRCPHCGEQTVAKLKVVMSGFTRTGDVLVCWLCGGELGVPEPPERAGDSARRERSAQLAKFLQAEAPEAVRLDDDAASRRFCKDCAEYVNHPFGARCGVDKRFVEPMDDCPRWRRRDGI